jgi:hypothetical protein
MNCLYSPERIARHAARIVFRKRGNHSEAHLSERELASIVESAVRVALEKHLVSACTGC